MAPHTLSVCSQNKVRLSLRMQNNISVTSFYSNSINAASTPCEISLCPLPLLHLQIWLDNNQLVMQQAGAAGTGRRTQRVRP